MFSALSFFDEKGFQELSADADRAIRDGNVEGIKEAARNCHFIVLEGNPEKALPELARLEEFLKDMGVESYFLEDDKTAATAPSVASPRNLPAVATPLLPQVFRPIGFCKQAVLGVFRKEAKPS